MRGLPHALAHLHGDRPSARSQSTHPAPRLSVKLGTPNACNLCHADKKPQWAADAVAKLVWPHTTSGSPLRRSDLGRSDAAARRGREARHACARRRATRYRTRDCAGIAEVVSGAGCDRRVPGRSIPQRPDDSPRCARRRRGDAARGTQLGCGCAAYRSGARGAHGGSAAAGAGCTERHRAGADGRVERRACGVRSCTARERRPPGGHLNLGTLYASQRKFEQARSEIESPSSSIPVSCRRT